VAPERTTSKRDDTIRHPRNGSGSSPDGAEARVLRAKYLDWCSAQVADHFLALSPEEIYELAERATQAEREAGGRSLPASGAGAAGEAVPGGAAAGAMEGGAAAGTEALASYREMVERVTNVLADQLGLPDYERWLELYRTDPAGVEAHLLGFWKEEM
jgi:hypothetical protein